MLKLGKKHKEVSVRRRRNHFGVARIFISLTMMSILGLGVYAAYKSFSGVDPLKISPRTALRSILNSDSAVSAVEGLLSFDPKQVVSDRSSTRAMGHSNSSGDSQATPKPTPKPRLLFSFALVADSENDNVDLKKALQQTKVKGSKFVVGLGDWTDVGTVDELRNTKSIFDTVNLDYHLIPGGHDFWDSRNRGLPPTTDYVSVFGANYSSFNYSGYKFILLDNSDNYYGVSSDQKRWFDSQLAEAKLNNQKIFLFVGEPLYHPSSDHVMGRVEPSLKSQANQLAKEAQDYGVLGVFGGDTHYFAQYTDPQTNMEMVAVGAITDERNLQNSRYATVDVYSDGSYNVTDTEVTP